MQCWLNWYSSGLEIHHSERISEFESQALRYIMWIWFPPVSCNALQQSVLMLLRTCEAQEIETPKTMLCWVGTRYLGQA